MWVKEREGVKELKEFLDWHVNKYLCWTRVALQFKVGFFNFFKLFFWQLHILYFKMFLAITLYSLMHSLLYGGFWQDDSIDNIYY